MNIILSPDFLEFDILLLFLFIICCISIYTSVSLKNRYDQYESFISGGSCCMERFHVVKLMDSMVTEIEKKVDEIILLKERNIKPESVRRKLNSKIILFYKLVKDTESKLEKFKSRFYKKWSKAKERAQQRQQQATASGASIDQQDELSEDDQKKKEEHNQKGREKADSRGQKGETPTRTI